MRNTVRLFWNFKMRSSINSIQALPGFSHSWGAADWWAIFVISVFWLIMAVLVNPIGDFPLNDDWAFAASVEKLIDSGNFVLPNWSAPNLLTHVVWGSLFAYIFGYSFTVLRISTLVLALIGLIATFKLLREIKLSSGTSLLAVMIIAANPVFFVSSNTFMTEVPFFSLSLISLFFLTKALSTERLSCIFIGSAAAVLALLVRQLGFAIPIGFAIA